MAQRAEAEWRARAVCGERERTAPLHWGPRLQRGLRAQTGKTNEAQPVFVCVCARADVCLVAPAECEGVGVCFQRLSARVLLT